MEKITIDLFIKILKQGSNNESGKIYIILKMLQDSGSPLTILVNKFDITTLPELALAIEKYEIKE